MEEDTIQENNKRSKSINPDSWQQGLQRLLRESRVACLASLGEYGPEASMAPFAIHEGDLLLHLSALAKHTGNIERDANIGIMICTAEAVADSALALPRVSLQGEIRAVGAEDMAAAKLSYLNNIPDAETLFSFADFRLFKLSPARIHWIGGFGKARKLSLQQWQSVT